MVTKSRIAKPRAESAEISRYFRALNPERRAALTRIRAVILAAAPKAEEMFSYGIPGFRVDAGYLLWYSAWRKHYSLHPVSPGMLAVLAKEKRVFKTTKGAVQFPADEPLPIPLIRKLVKVRLAERAG